MGELTTIFTMLVTFSATQGDLLFIFFTSLIVKVNFLDIAVDGDIIPFTFHSANANTEQVGR